MSGSSRGGRGGSRGRGRGRFSERVSRSRSRRLRGRTTSDSSDSSSEEERGVALENKEEVVDARASRAARGRQSSRSTRGGRSGRAAGRARRTTADYIRDVTVLTLPDLVDRVAYGYPSRLIRRINPSQSTTIDRLSNTLLRSIYNDNQRFDTAMMQAIVALNLPALRGPRTNALDRAFLTINESALLTASAPDIRRAMQRAAATNETRLFRALLHRLSDLRVPMTDTELAFALSYEMMSLDYSPDKLRLFSGFLTHPSNGDFLRTRNRAGFRDAFRSIVRKAEQNPVFDHFVQLDFTDGSWARFVRLMEDAIASDNAAVWFPYFALWKWSEGGYAAIEEVQSKPWLAIANGTIDDLLIMLGAHIGVQKLIDEGFTPALNDRDQVYSWEKGFPERGLGEIFLDVELGSTSLAPVTTYGFSAPTTTRWQTCRVIYRPTHLAMIQPIGGKRFYWQREALSAGNTLSMTISREQLDESTMGTVEIAIDGSLLEAQIDDRRFEISDLLLIAEDSRREERALKMIINHQHIQSLRAVNRLGRAAGAAELRFLIADVEDFDHTRVPEDWRDLYGANVRNRWIAALNTDVSRADLMTSDFVKRLYGIIQGTAGTDYRRPDRNLQWANLAPALSRRERTVMARYHYLTVVYGVDTSSRAQLDSLERWAIKERNSSVHLLQTRPPGVTLNTRNGLLDAIEMAKQGTLDSSILDLTETGWSRYQDFLELTTGARSPETFSVYYASSVAWGADTFDLLIDNLLKSVAKRTDMQYRAFRARVISAQHYTAWLQRTSAMLQQRLVAIHPYLDGNGRVSRAMMAMYLKLHLPLEAQHRWENFLPDLTVNPDSDLVSTTDEWADLLFPNSGASLSPRSTFRYYNQQRERDEEIRLLDEAQQADTELALPPLPVAFDRASSSSSSLGDVELLGGDALS